MSFLFKRQLDQVELFTLSFFFGGAFGFKHFLKYYFLQLLFCFEEDIQIEVVLTGVMLRLDHQLFTQH